jgi:hypothetical protein
MNKLRLYVVHNIINIKKIKRTLLLSSILENPQVLDN